MNIILKRPAGVWDSRVPLASFIRAHTYLIRLFNIASLSTEHLRSHATSIGEAVVDRSYFPLNTAGHISRKAWNSLVRTYGLAGEERLPSGFELAEDSRSAFGLIVHLVMIRYIAIFEIHLHCWTLNMLLGELEEGGGRLTPDMEKLISHYSPDQNLPNIHKIKQAVPSLVERLRTTSVFQPGSPQPDGSRGSIQQVAATEAFNAWKSLEFWRRLRNVQVHRLGVISTKFLQDNRTFLETLAAVCPVLRDLERGVFKPTDHVFQAATLCHVQAAYAMNDLLYERTAGRRGMALARGTGYVRAMTVRIPDPIPKLLLEGDHGPSLRWTTDREFRTGARA